MKKLTTRKARESLGKLDLPLAKKGELTITRPGKEIARAVPVDTWRPIPSCAELRSRVPRLNTAASSAKT